MVIAPTVEISSSASTPPIIWLALPPSALFATTTPISIFPCILSMGVALRKVRFSSKYSSDTTAVPTANTMGRLRWGLSSSLVR